MTAPIRRIAENAGKNKDIIIEEIQKGEFTYGYNSAKDSFGDMFEFCIVDPAKVSRSALQNATSISGMILTTECIVVENENSNSTQ